MDQDPRGLSEARDDSASLSWAAQVEEVHNSGEADAVANASLWQTTGHQLLSFPESGGETPFWRVIPQGPTQSPRNF